MAENIEVRKIPKKTFVYIAILIILGILSFFIVENGKSTKATKVLKELGFKKVSDITVFAKTEFLNEGTNVKGYQYSLQFTDLVTNKKCKGFIMKDFKGNISKDLKCQ